MAKDIVTTNDVISASDVISAGDVISGVVSDVISGTDIGAAEGLVIPGVDASSALRIFVSAIPGADVVVGDQQQHQPDDDADAVMHQCGLCGKLFPHDWDLKRHEKIVHNKLNDLNCLQCGKAFKLLAALQKHVKTAHQKPRFYHCKFCYKSFSESGNLQVCADFALDSFSFSKCFLLFLTGARPNRPPGHKILQVRRVREELRSIRQFELAHPRW